MRSRAAAATWPTWAVTSNTTRLLIVSRRLGHSSPTTTYAYLEYTDDPLNAVDAAFRAWTVQDGDTYADIASRMLSEAVNSDASPR